MIEAKYKALGGSLLLITLLIGGMMGYMLTPEYRFASATHTQSFESNPQLADLYYLNDMAAHHMQAILLAQQAEKHSRRPEIRALAKEIQANEPKLITNLLTWKKEWYRDYRPLPQKPVVQLGTYDNSFDLRFLNALINHHNEGIAVTKTIRTISTRSLVLNDADAVEAFLSRSLITLSTWRTQWYLNK